MVKVQESKKSDVVKILALVNALNTQVKAERKLTREISSMLKSQMIARTMSDMKLDALIEVIRDDPDKMKQYKKASA